MNTSNIQHPELGTHQGAVPIPITVGRVVLAPTAGGNPEKQSLTEAVLRQRVCEPFIGSTEMFRVEQMGDLRGHFTRLGRALERLDKSPADIAHAHALAEELTRLLALAGVEMRCDESGTAR